MSNSNFKKGLIIGIIFLFIGASVLPNISGNIEKINNLQYDFFGKKQNINNNLKAEIKNDLVGKNFPDNADWWPQYQHNPQNTGVSTSNGPETDHIKWTKQMDEIWKCPVVADGKLFVSPTTFSVYQTLYCLDAETGDNLWSYYDGNTMTHCPAYANNKIYFGSEHNLCCLDANTGSVIWQNYLGVTQYCSPTVVNNKVYCGSDINGKLYCLDGDTGNLIWDYDVYPAWRKAPAVYNDKVFISSDSGYILCLNANNGDFIWQYSMTFPSSPAVTNGKVYVNSYYEKTYCLDAETGAYIWSQNLGGGTIYPLQNVPVVNGNYVYSNMAFACYCLNAETGSILWSHDEGWSYDNSPIVADGKIYIATDMKLFCLDSVSGDDIWNKSVGEVSYSTPAIANSKLYIGNTDGELYCFGDNDLMPQIVMTPMEQLYFMNGIGIMMEHMMKVLLIQLLHIHGI